MSEHPPVTEEMVEAGRNAYRTCTGCNKSSAACQKSIIREILEAAQAVAPPKETADTKRQPSSPSGASGTEEGSNCLKY